jgi:hypothetical protein
MPSLDGTGPDGKGPKTGEQRGCCVGKRLGQTDSHRGGRGNGRGCRIVRSIRRFFCTRKNRK